VTLSNIDTNDIEVTGTLAMDDITLQGSGFLETLLSVSGGATRGAKLTVRPTHFVVADGLMKYTDTMQIEVGDNPFNFKGGIHLDGRFKDFSVITPYTTAGRTVNVNKESPGERIVLPVEGTVKDYKIPLEKVLEQNLKDKAIKEGLKLLDGLFK
jgi:hypothetical protein